MLDVFLWGMGCLMFELEVVDAALSLLVRSRLDNCLVRFVTVVAFVVMIKEQGWGQLAID